MAARPAALPLDQLGAPTVDNDAWPATPTDQSTASSWDGQSLWDQIQGWLKPAEVDEVRRAIGSKLIDRNQALLDEINALNDMLDDFVAQNEDFLRQKRGRAKERRALLGSGGERQMLEQQIRLLLAKLGDSHNTNTTSRSGGGSGGGRSGSSAGLADDKVYRYLTRGGPGRGGDEPFQQSARSVPHSSRPSSACSSLLSTRSARSAPDVLGVNQVGVNNIEQVAGMLRALFNQEEKALLAEIEAVTNELDQEDDRRTELNAEVEASAAVPSTTELRAFNNKLEKQWLSSDQDQALRRAPPLGNSSNSLRPKRPLLPAKNFEPARIGENDLLRRGGPLGGGDTAKQLLSGKAPLKRRSKHTGAASESDDQPSSQHPPPPPARAQSSSRPMSARFRARVASASEQARDEFHLSDERFLT